MTGTLAFIAGLIVLGFVHLAIGILIGRMMADRSGRSLRWKKLGENRKGTAGGTGSAGGVSSTGLPVAHQEMAARLYRLVSDVRDELGAHREHIEQLARQLAERADSDPRELARVFLEAIARSLQINLWLRDRLMEVEERLHVQAQELKRFCEEARTDPLTGLVNRRAFDAALQDALRQAEQSGQPVGLLLVDLDHFKRFNDELGHPTGDLLLKNLAARLKNLAPDCTVARVGGEEFAVLFNHHSPEEAEAIARRIHQAVKAPVSTPAGTVSYTVSGGLAWAEAGDRASTLYERADQALYAAKRSGRDCILAATGNGYRRISASATSEQFPEQKVALTPPVANWPAGVGQVIPADRGTTYHHGDDRGQDRASAESGRDDAPPQEAVFRESSNGKTVSEHPLPSGVSPISISAGGQPLPSGDSTPPHRNDLERECTVSEGQSPAQAESLLTRADVAEIVEELRQKLHQLMQREFPG